MAAPPAAVPGMDVAGEGMGAGGKGGVPLPPLPPPLVAPEEDEEAAEKGTVVCGVTCRGQFEPWIQESFQPVAFMEVDTKLRKYPWLLS